MAELLDQIKPEMAEGPIEDKPPVVFEVLRFSLGVGERRTIRTYQDAKYWHVALTDTTGRVAVQQGESVFEMRSFILTGLGAYVRMPLVSHSLTLENLGAGDVTMTVVTYANTEFELFGGTAV